MHLCGATEEEGGRALLAYVPLLFPLFLQPGSFLMSAPPSFSFSAAKAADPRRRGESLFPRGSKSGLFRSCEHSPGFPTQGGKKPIGVIILLLPSR